MSAATPLESLLTFLRFPSVSTDPVHVPDIEACARWLAGELTVPGLDATIHRTSGHPIVLARNRRIEGRKTVLIYGHYDVQPVDPLPLWISPPFEPEIRDGRIFARGSTDNKGQLMAHVCGLKEALRHHGDLPVNIICLFEGEEEIGSPSLAPFLRERAGELRCDVVAVSDTGMIGPGVPTFTYGLRGIICLELVVSGPAHDLHSGIFGGCVANPATELARLIGALHDDTGRVRVDGFYDAVRPLETWEREAWSRLPIGDADALRLTGAPKLHGEAGFNSLERLWARPTAEVNGIGGGYQGKGSKTVIPSSAFAKLSFRLVPDQDPEDVAAKVSAWLRERSPDTVHVSVVPGHHGRPYMMEPGSRFGLAAQRALRRSFGRDPVLIREGGSIPIVQAFKDTLGVDTLLLGLALPDCQAHAPNENFPVENFEAGIRLHQRLLEETAAA
jgi:acetylornithine deacetylase/succinyl-diaminopimelate desuccinylase-like protein